MMWNQRLTSDRALKVSRIATTSHLERNLASFHRIAAALVAYEEFYICKGAIHRVDRHKFIILMERGSLLIQHCI